MASKAFYTKEEIDQAKNVDLIDFIRRCEYEVIPKGPRAHCLKEHDSFVITNNRWIWNRENIGGSVIDFAMHYPNKNTRTFTEAMNYIQEIMNNGRVSCDPRESKSSEKKETSKTFSSLALPDRYQNNKRVFAYLSKTRCIDKDIVWDMIKQRKIYECAQYHNCVFLGNDKEGSVRYAAMRGTLAGRKYVQECEGSSVNFGFVMEGRSNKLYVFEDSIDALSHATFTKLEGKDYTEDHRLALHGNCTQYRLLQYLNDNPNLNHVVFCLDNDLGGRNATTRLRHILSSELSERKLFVDVLTPIKKDFNEDLKCFFEKQLQNGRVM